MFVELHILQNFAPSNLNRDDTNAPKDCEFGGYRRARISSQCLKRAIRTSFKDDRLLPGADLAIRTKRLTAALASRLEAEGKPVDEAQQVVERALASVGIKVEGEKTQYLVFLGEREVAALANACASHWDELLAATSADAAGKNARQAKKGAKDAVPPAVSKAVKAALDGGKAADLALFGRMLADLPERNIDAASQVAHAISTNRVSTEFDFYTAVDDLKPEDTSGADMLGTVEFNSACFYRYANVDTDQLLENLDGDAELAKRTLSAFLRASVLAVPTGKQNSMAAHNPPSLVFAVVRGRGLQNLSNAFVEPVTPDRQSDLVRRSAQQLNAYYGELKSMYGDGSTVGTWVAATQRDGVEQLAAEVVPLEALIDGVTKAVPFGGAA